MLTIAASKFMTGTKIIIRKISRLHSLILPSTYLAKVTENKPHISSTTQEQSVINLLAPFMDSSMDDGSYSHLQFHNAIMRWKCSCLTDEECQEHQEWIDQKQLEKDNVVKHPWKAMQGEGNDKLVIENSYIQRCVCSSLLAMVLPTNLSIQLYQRSLGCGLQSP